jgi:hypothetical protein
MNLPSAFSPLIVHIPHAVPVVIVWGIMLRFYLVSRKEKARSASLGGPAADPVTPSSIVDKAADRPVERKVWAVDDTPDLGVPSGRPAGPVLGRTPVGRL